MRIVVPGDYVDEGFIAGHGTYEQEGKIYASLAGIVHRIDKVICVKPLKTSFKPDIGDVIIGRIVAVENKRWTVDINSYQHGVLNLTNINLPGGLQRRRSEEDKMQMRNYFKENDIISGEVQSINTHDGKINMQTRNLKYGKLINGFLIKVDHNYIRRMKSHILEFFQEDWQPIACIIGTNGYIWIYTPDKLTQNTQQSEVKVISKETRVKMAVLRNSIIILEKVQLPIFKDTIQKVLDSQRQNAIEAKDMLKSYEILGKEAKYLIESEINLKKPVNLQLIQTDINNQDFIMN
ncbi:exosome complex exonuclease rrp4 [Stylonychia lemnae]|uniref:Exosome complex exonuclease rrp4 n=1 Tax=Stylonychia lemnae TaxID=5949 RepID=A0A078A9U7_STYLE|nr:exosome complex exonuclease rrp4 [Stylonychia lemnae]|eukprot:CDW78954.1 exosome complex exonuclease rrp4 [Stylonychia lemnae]